MRDLYVIPRFKKTPACGRVIDRIDAGSSRPANSVVANGRVHGPE
jgi:hypothetical protein